MHRAVKLAVVIGIVGIIASACGSGAKSVSISGPVAVTRSGAAFTATAEGGTPMFGQVVFSWEIAGKAVGTPKAISVDASGRAEHIVFWRPTSSTPSSVAVTVAVIFVEPGTNDYERRFDQQIVYVQSSGG